MHEKVTLIFDESQQPPPPLKVCRNRLDEFNTYMGMPRKCTRRMAMKFDKKRLQWIRCIDVISEFMCCHHQLRMSDQ
jgi:hypothetical protein